MFFCPGMRRCQRLPESYAPRCSSPATPGLFKSRARCFSGISAAFVGDSAGLCPELRSVHIQITVDLPRRNVAAETVPFGALGGEVVAEDVVAQRLAHELALLEFVERFAQVR